MELAVRSRWRMGHDDSIGMRAGVLEYLANLLVEIGLWSRHPHRSIATSANASAADLSSLRSHFDVRCLPNERGNSSLVPVLRIGETREHLRIDLPAIIHPDRLVRIDDEVPVDVARSSSASSSLGQGKLILEVEVGIPIDEPPRPRLAVEPSGELLDSG